MRAALFVTLLFTLFLTTAGVQAANLASDQPVVFNFSSDADELVLEIAHPGDRFLAVSVDFSTAPAAGAIRVTGESRLNAGEVSWTTGFDREVYAHDGPLSIIDNMQPAPGAWKLTVKPVSVPVSGTFRLIDLGQLTKIDFTQKTGAICIKKPDSAEFIACGTADHPDFGGAGGEFTGSVNADGDVMIPLPVGFYTLRHPAPLVSSVQAHMIPVHAGKVTVIENWPKTPQPEPVAGEEGVAAGPASVTAQIEKELRIRSVKLLDGDKVSVRFATPHWQGVVSKEELEAKEGGVNAEVVEATTVATPLNLTILLDSSGSMKKDMKLALESVEQFIRLLPADSEITLVDFDTKAREVAAKDRNALLKALKAVKADGATCLNDSVMLGLEKSESRGRPAILLFTDGFDANHNDTGPGSITKPEEMFEAVKSSEVPIFTIGFGAKPDDATLKRLATLSGGFYSKADKNNIGRVFAQVASILGREHEMIYRRPGVRGNSDAPVISIVLDVSGSMDMPPAEEGCDYRLEKAKAILRSLINKLPEGAIAQITTYSYYQNIVQVFTGDRMQLLASIAPIKAGGGTATLETLQVAFKMLKEVPTDRKYMLFITDAGLNVAEGSQEEETVEYQAVLGSIKDAGIQMTWIGMVDDKDRAPFDYAARLCNGRAVVSTDFAAVQEAIDNLGRSILNASGTSDGRIPVQLTFSRREGNGRMLIMNAAEKFALPAPPVTDKAAVNGLKFSFIDMPQNLERYSLELSQSLYGDSKTRDETVISQRLPINAVSSNGAMKLTVVETLLMSKFRGISLPCAAIRLRLENILPEQEVAVMSESESHPASFVGNAGKPQKTTMAVPPYLIPDLRNHFFARFNNLAAVPVSDLSWVVAEPLMTPDDESLLLKPGEALEGYLVFEYGDPGTLKKASLSYFDTVYGHMQVPIIGTLDSVVASATAAEMDRITQLPQEVEGSISEAFKLRINGYGDKTLPEPDNHLIMRVFDLQIVSQVQAHLDLNPVERLSLLLPTRFGNLVLEPSPRTAALPLGWHRPILLLPGSNNILKQAYILPKTLSDKVKGVLRVDISGSEQLLSAGDKPVKADQPLCIGKGDKVSLALNAYRVENGEIFLDLTMSDEKDGEGTSIPVTEVCQILSGDETLVAENLEAAYLFQADKDVVAADGQQRRFLLVIKLPDEDGAPILLKSGLFKLERQLKAAGEGKFDDYMLACGDGYRSENQAGEEIAALVEKVFAERRASGWKKPGSSGSVKISPASGSSIAQSEKVSAAEGRVLSPPDFRAATASRLQTVLKMTETEFTTFVRNFRCQPSDANILDAVYAPEAMLMQNWGTQNDLCELAKLYYESSGAMVGNSSKLAVLTEKGKEELFKRTGWKSELEQLPVLSVGQRNLVVPFFMDAGEMSACVSEILDESSGSSTTRGASINISLRVKPENAGQAGKMGSMGGALGGDSDEDSSELIPLFETGLLSYSACSRAPIDIFYVSPDGGQTLYAMAEGADGKIENRVTPVSLAENEVLEEILEIRLDEEVLSFVRPIDKESSLIDTFRTMALCMPDFTASAATALADEFAARKTAEAPDTRSTAKWFARSKIFRFLALHSEAEAEAVRKTGVKISRPGDHMRAIILTLNGEKDSIRAVFDLRQINPRVQGDGQAVKAFNFFMGTANALIEEQIMGGGGLLSRWQCGGNQKLMVVGPDDMGGFIEGLDPQMLPAQTISLLENAAEQGRGVIFPTMAPVIDGKARAAWFVFDPETYAMISVLDNGAHGSMVEKPITEIIQDAAKYGVGFFVGVNTSVWAVTAYSIKYDDMRLVVKAAKSLCLSIAEQLQNIGKPLKELLPEIPTSVTAHEVEASAGPVSVKVGFGELSADGFKAVTRPNISFNLSYQSGFEDAVKAYFHD